MAKQTGVVKLKGTIGGITFYSLENKEIARGKSSLDKQRVSTDPAFAGSRRASLALGKGAKAYNVLKHAFHPYLMQAADARQAGRASALLAKVVRADTASKAGEEKIKKEHLHILKGFEGNKHAGLSSVMDFNVRTSIDRNAGTVSFDIPAFNPHAVIKSPQGATHYQIRMAAATADFDKAKTEKDVRETEWLKLDNKKVAAWQEVLQFTAGSKLPVLAGVGIRFAALEHGSVYVLNNNEFSAFRIVEVFV